jgi:hypothetical protein
VKAKLNVALPVLCMSCFPILMLAFPTESMITNLWSAAMMVLSLRIGIDMAPWISKRAAIRWLIFDAALFLLLVFWGVLGRLGSAETLGHKLGSLAVMQVGIFLPIGVLLSKIIEKRGKKA